MATQKTEAESDETPLSCAANRRPKTEGASGRDVTALPSQRNCDSLLMTGLNPIKIGRAF